MISKTARSSVAGLKAKGLEPTFEDVVRLNALGLKLEASKSRNQMESTWHLQRVAQISESLAFRQPTVGHEIWFDKVKRFCDPNDVDTAMAVNAFALSRSHHDLPDGDDPRAVKIAVEKFAETCSDYTRDQIYAALMHVIYGYDPSDGERPARKKREDADGSLFEDWDECYAVGVLHEGHAVLWGLSGAEMKAMTPRQLCDVIRRAKYFHGKPDSSESDRLEGEFFATVDEIEERLTREKKNG